MWNPSRSPWPRRSTSPTGAASTTAPAPSATWSRTTCCRSGHGMADPPEEQRLQLARLQARLVSRGPRADGARPVRGYLDVKGVAKDSTLETRRRAAGVRLLAVGRGTGGNPVEAMPVTRPGLCQFQAPPRDIFGLAPLRTTTSCGSGSGPETVTLTLAGKKPGFGWEPQTDDLRPGRVRPAAV